MVSREAELRRYRSVIGIRACILCGAMITIRRARWMNELRAIYTQGCDWPNPRCSGVGTIRSEKTATVPSDYTMRYDDPNCTGNDCINVRCGNPILPAIENGSSSRGVGAPPLRHGFFFHDTCWCILQEACRPAEVDITILNEFCRSFFDRVGFVDWGHDYGGISFRLPDFCSSDVRLETTLTIAPDHPSHQLGVNDPVNIPEVRELLLQPVGSRPVSVGSVDGFNCQSLQSFMDLPAELLMRIAFYLPSKAVLNFKLACRAFACINLPQAFWRSRFCFNFEYACIFEVHGISQRFQDWRSLYFGFRQAEVSSAQLRNRKRIWTLLASLTNKISLYSNHGLHGDPWPTVFDIDIKPASSIRHWRYAGGGIENPPRTGGSHTNWCMSLYVRSVSLPAAILGFFVSLVELEEMTYITGIRFVDSNNQSFALGYIFPLKEQYVDMESMRGGFHLVGFKLGTAHRGVCAISGVMSNGNTTEWAGSPSNLPRMNIIGSKAVQHLKGTFDGFKITTLAIPAENMGCTRDPALLVQGHKIISAEDKRLLDSLSIRDVAQWYPGVPTNKQYLNESSFGGSDHASSRRGPIVSIFFGGDQGAELSKLVAVSAWVIAKEDLMGIEFEFIDNVGTEKGENVNSGGLTFKSIGYCGPFKYEEFATAAEYEDHIDDEDFILNEKIRFDIDGPGGEIIEEVYWTDYDPWSVPALKLCTNRGRSICFPEKLPARKHLVKEPGTTITGFYCTHFRHVVVCLGVISEALPDI